MGLRNKLTPEQRKKADAITGAWPFDLEEMVYELISLRDEVESLRAFKRGVDEALNSGDGSYRP